MTLHCKMFLKLYNLVRTFNNFNHYVDIHQRFDKSGNLERVQQLIWNRNVNILDRNQRAPLHEAAELGNLFRKLIGIV